MKMKFMLSILVIFVLSVGGFANPKNPQMAEKPKKEKGFKTIWDGKTFNGWKIAEPEKNSWSIKDGAIIAKGERSHVYYVGDPKPFVNFESRRDDGAEIERRNLFPYAMAGSRLAGQGLRGAGK